MIDQLNKTNSNEDEEIELSTFLNILLRNKFFILKLGVLFFIVSCLYSLTQKRVWQGQFEIVLENKDKNNGSSVLNQISQLTALGMDKENDLKTEVGILNSPSVLKPVFNYTNTIKSDLNKRYKSQPFSSWNKNLKVQLRKTTSIVNVSYKDQNKDIIIPVLEKISSTYQDYSGSKKNRTIELSKTYLKKQILLYKEKSKESKKIALNYAIDQNLNLNDLDNKNFSKFNANISDAISALGDIRLAPMEQDNLENNSLEALRVNLKNEINEIDLQIKKLKSLNDINDLQYIGSTIKPLIDQGLPQTLERIETQLIQLRAKYTEKDISIINLLERRDLYIQLLKERAIGYLKAKKISYESKLESVERPKGVILKGKELMRESSRDERTLVDLENNLRNIELAEARLEDPWKLITNPTLSNIPVYPNRSKMGLTGLVMGLIFGSIYSYIKERNSNLIFEENELEKIFSKPILKRLNLNKKQNDLSKKELRFEELENISKNKIKLIFLSIDSESDIKERFEGLFTNISKEKFDFIYSVDNLTDHNPKDFYLLVTSLGKINYLDVKDFKNRIELLKIDLNGIIII